MSGRNTFEKIGEDEQDDRKMRIRVLLQYLSPSTVARQTKQQKTKSEYVQKFTWAHYYLRRIYWDDM
jgi:hypothetical protein